MGPFVFSLERMRKYRDQILTAEKNRLVALQKKRDEIQDRIIALEQYRLQTCKEMDEKRRKGTNIMELGSFQYLVDQTKRQKEEQNQQLLVVNDEIGKQLKVVIAASREITSLDKLEERQLEEYRILAARDEEIKTSEQVMLSIARSKSNQGNT